MYPCYVFLSGDTIPLFFIPEFSASSLLPFSRIFQQCKLRGAEKMYPCYVFLSGGIILLLFIPEFSVSFVSFFQCLTPSCLDVQWVAAASLLCHRQMDIEAFGKKVNMFLWPRRCFITWHCQEPADAGVFSQAFSEVTCLCSLLIK